jgi:hypothetical protein
MKKILISLSIIFLAFSASATNNAEQKESKSEVKQHLQNHFKLYGFIRNFFVFDSRDSKAGTGDLFYYLPLDNKWNTTDVNNPAREDLNASPNFRFLALTSRVGMDVSGYYYKNVHFGAKVEADFYAGLGNATTANGLSGNTKISGTAQMRLRQAYATVTWKDLPLGEDKKAEVGLKIGQAWHPMAADMPHVFSLEAGAPFGPFSRTPQVTMDASLGKNFVLSASAIWQMQYQSSGPSNSSAAYMKYGCTPEMYFGLTYKHKGFLGRVGADLLSIKPRNIGAIADPTDPTKTINAHVKDRKTSLLYYAYAQYNKGKFSVKAKTTYGESGEHMNLMGGYAVVDKTDPANWKYASLRNSSSWVSLSYGKKWQGVLFAGYLKNLGLAKEADGNLLSTAGDSKKQSEVYFCGNGSSNIHQVYRINPQVLYNFGKFTIGLEYQWTSVQYGDYINAKRFSVNEHDKPVVVTDKYVKPNGLATDNLHWVGNHRVNMMVKFTF